MRGFPAAFAPGPPFDGSGRDPLSTSTDSFLRFETCSARRSGGRRWRWCPCPRRSGEQGSDRCRRRCRRQYPIRSRHRRVRSAHPVRSRHRSGPQRHVSPRTGWPGRRSANLPRAGRGGRELLQGRAGRHHEFLGPTADGRAGGRPERRVLRTGEPGGRRRHRGQCAPPDRRGLQAGRVRAPRVREAGHLPDFGHAGPRRPAAAHPRRPHPAAARGPVPPSGRTGRAGDPGQSRGPAGWRWRWPSVPGAPASKERSTRRPPPFSPGSAGWTCSSAAAGWGT